MSTRRSTSRGSWLDCGRWNGNKSRRELLLVVLGREPSDGEIEGLELIEVLVICVVGWFVR